MQPLWRCNARHGCRQCAAADRRRKRLYGILRHRGKTAVQCPPRGGTNGHEVDKAVEHVGDKMDEAGDRIKEAITPDNK